MIGEFKSTQDRVIVEDIFSDQVTLKHRVSERFSDDIKDALREILNEYDELKFEVGRVSEMERHIDKLEAILDRRKIRYKKWEDVY